MRARVTKIIDGDTFWALVRIEGGKEFELKFRIQNINAPERGQAHWRESRDYLSSLILNEEIHVKVEGLGQFNRVLCVPIVENERLDEKLVREGMAWHSIKYSQNPALIECEQEAISAQRGLWQPQVLSAHFERYERALKTG